MKRIVLALLLLRCTCVLSQVIPEKPNPKVRAITAFVRVDRTNFLKQIEDAVVVLRRAESEFKSLGYDVETIRITTQPLAELVSGLSEEGQAGGLLRANVTRSGRQAPRPAVGPVYLRRRFSPRLFRRLRNWPGHRSTSGRHIRPAN